ncbi:GDSL-type esterase/lipase family protein [Polycladomyces subterraneus]|uniref:GDSL-type esterase/lipase family protein n=1 Tax=Polycladomyces subterraneus TaxID=1016997 RepID=A0ABT8IR72_9BACL|nr:GDSL-type esterase/lipase family protein [Polycladomyces subterraneus]MDN4595295.1 GDSL-type esterase/lipase family protein [Polycladomyces subterraneus]
MSQIAYLALGDSLTEGIGAHIPFVEQFFDHLRRTDDCRVRNWGVSGMTSEELLSMLGNPGIGRLVARMSHITVTTGGCDFIRTYETDGVSIISLTRTMRRVQMQVDRILGMLRQYNPEATIHLLGFYLPLPAYEQGLWLATRLITSMNQAYQRLCRKHRVYWVDPFDTFLHRHDYFADEVHPNQKGHDQLARLFIQTADPERAGSDTGLVLGDEGVADQSPTVIS